MIFVGLIIWILVIIYLEIMILILVGLYILILEITYLGQIIFLLVIIYAESFMQIFIGWNKSTDLDNKQPEKKNYPFFIFAENFYKTSMA